MSKYQIQVKVRSRHLPEQSAPAQGLYVFAYTITLTNTGSVAAQLIARSWNVTDAHGRTQIVRGLGVVGQQPLLQAGSSFEYSSSTQLRTPSGSMQGSYFFVAVDGTRFDVGIPLFMLDAQNGNDGPQTRTLH